MRPTTGYRRTHPGVSGDGQRFDGDLGEDQLPMV